MSVYKKLTPSDVSITPFNTHKQYTYNSSSAGQNGVTFYSGQYSSQSIDFYEKYDVLGSKKYFQLDELYYNDYKLDIANMFGDISYTKTQRTLYDKANILSVPSALYGYQIKPTTFYLSGSFGNQPSWILTPPISRSAIVTDDGKGNLISNDFTTGTDNFRDVVKRLMYVGSDNAFRQYNLDIYNHDNRNRPRHIGEPIENAPTSFNTPSDEFVYDNSYYFNQLVYKDITFSPLALTGSYNYPGIDFNGSTSYIQSPHNEKFDFNPEDDFAVSFFVNSKSDLLVEKYGGEGADVDNGEGGAQISWTNPTNAEGVADGSGATTPALTAQTSSLLELTKFGLSIPSTAFDIKIAASIVKRTRKSGDVIKDHIVQLRYLGGYIGDNKADLTTNWPLISYTTVEYNPLFTLGFWGATLTPTIVNHTTFGIGIAVDGTSTDTVDVDSIKLSITYSVHNENGYIVSKSTTKTVVTSPQEGKSAVYNLSNTGSGTVDVFAEPQYPFEIYFNNGSIYFDRFDGNNKTSISTSTLLSESLHHIHCQKTGSEMEIYVDAVKQVSGSDTTVKHTQNKANVYIGTKGNKSNYFSGSLSQIMIYEDAFNQNQINNSYNTVTNTPVIGNIIYPHGIATITKPEYQGILNEYVAYNTTGSLITVGNAWDPPNYLVNSEYDSEELGTGWSCIRGTITVDNVQYQIVSSSATTPLGYGEKLYIQGNLHIATPTSYSLDCYFATGEGGVDINDYQLKFQASHLIYENELLCTCDENEFNNTNNVTVRKIPTIDNQDLANFATSSLFKPYATTIGLYNEDNVLLLVGKLGQPVRMSDETDTTFLVRYDT